MTCCKDDAVAMGGGGNGVAINRGGSWYPPPPDLSLLLLLANADDVMMITVMGRGIGDARRLLEFNDEDLTNHDSLLEHVGSVVPMYYFKRLHNGLLLVQMQAEAVNVDPLLGRLVCSKGCDCACGGC